jgi:hypothetical protein
MVARQPGQSDDFENCRQPIHGKLNNNPLLAMNMESKDVIHVW